MITGFIQLSPSGARSTSATQELPLGTVGVTKDGRVYRYCRAGASTLNPGQLCVVATQTGNNENLAVQAAAAVNATQVSVTLGASSVTADQYKDGFLVINDADGEGIAYRIASHPAATNATTLTVTLDSEEPVRVALTISSEASLVLNPYADVVISVADQADQPAGIPNVSITNAQYGWLQTRGVCSALADEAFALGDMLTTGTSVVGALEAHDAAGEPLVGTSLQTAVDTEYRAVYLMLD